MKKIKKTSEEKRAIKEFKSESKKRIKREKSFRREHIYLIFAISILIIFIFILVYLLFFSKKKELIVPDLPTYEQMDVGYVDFSESGSNANNLNSKKNNNVSVDYKIVSDYYKKGILLSNTQAYNLNNQFIITSGQNSSVPFISSLTYDGSIKWLTKLAMKDYKKINIIKVVFYNDYYYIAGTAENNTKKAVVIIKVASNGKQITERIIKEEDTKVKDLLVAKDKIVLITSNAQDITINFTDAELNSNKNEIKLSSVIKDASSLNYHTSSVIDANVNLVLNSESVFYIANLNADTYLLSHEEFQALNELKTDKTIRVKSYLKGFAAYTNMEIYKYDPDNKLINKFDYNNVKLENDSFYKEQYIDGEYITEEDLTNRIHIERVENDNNKIIVKLQTLYSTIYDIYDLNLKINKRIILDQFKYSYDDGVLLNSFYIDDQIYEVYSYGTETPSIMISKIGIGAK